MKRIIAVLAAGLFCAVAAHAADFQLLVTETPPGIGGPLIPQNQWGGVLRYNIAGSGGAATALSGIPAAQVNDPDGVAVRANGEILVGNRHGNSGAASVSRFTLDTNTDTYVPSGSIIGNSLWGVHETNVSPVTGELFAANFGGGISRFTFDGSGNAAANGTLGGFSYRGAIVSPDGQRLYATTSLSTLYGFDVTTNASLPNFAVPGAVGLHFGAWGPLGQLYVADYGGGVVHRIAFDANHNPTYAGSIAGATGAMDVAFSPDGMEMFVAGHSTGIISRYSYIANIDFWLPNGTITTGSASLGSIVVVPEPASILLLASGAVLAGRRRRSL